MSHKASLACAGAFAAVASLAGIGPALSHTIVGNRVFPATLDIDDPGVNDELSIPTFAYLANPDNSNEYDFNFEYAKTITADLGFSIGNTLYPSDQHGEARWDHRHAEWVGRYRNAVEIPALRQSGA